MRSDGRQIEAIARRLGTPLTPMQRYVADVGTERKPDGSFNYPLVVWTVPRQTGKTTGLRSIGTHRCAVCGQDVYYTAQTGKDARKRWEDLVKLVRTSAWADRVKVSLRGGSEAVTFADGAGFHVFAPTPESLHGYTPPCVFIDEAFALPPGAGELLMGAISPGQLTIAQKQIWIVSTMGTAESTFLHDWIDRARDGEPGIALFDWGAGDHHDPYNLDHIAQYHPGVGFDFNGKVLTASDVLAESTKNSQAEYIRAFANRATPTTTNLVPLDEWLTLRVESLDAPAGCVLTYDVAADREGATLIASWVQGDSVCVQVMAADAGARWLTSAVPAYIERLRPREVVAAENGPVLEVTAALRARGVHVRTVTEREYATATGALLSRIEDRTLCHDGREDGTDRLSRSITGIVTRPGSVDGVAISRRLSVGDASAAVAAALGAHIAGTEPETRPFVVFAS